VDRDALFLALANSSGHPVSTLVAAASLQFGNVSGNVTGTVPILSRFGWFVKSFFDPDLKSKTQIDVSPSHCQPQLQPENILNTP
jgi:hypothetical protein